MKACEGRVFQGSAGAFCGGFWDYREVWLGCFAAKFRGFWVACGRGEAIQRTADAVGAIGRKNFLKRGGKLKIGV